MFHKEQPALERGRYAGTHNRPANFETRVLCGACTQKGATRKDHQRRQSLVGKGSFHPKTYDRRLDDSSEENQPDVTEVLPSRAADQKL